MKENKPLFTPEEISKIDKALPFIVFDWAKNLIFHIINKAQSNNIKVIYMNTSETLNGSNTEIKVEHFYEKLPSQIGFKKEKVNLRNKTEIFWAYRFATIASRFLNLIKTSQRTFSLNEIPPTKQGAVLHIIGKKPAYTAEELRKVYEIISKNSKPKESVARFFYDWTKTWSGGQRFLEGLSSKPDQVVVQKIPVSLQNKLTQDETLSKFWDFIMKQSNHFGCDSLGFALVNKYSDKIWVINEIQTDTLNHYMHERNKHYIKDVGRTDTSTISWDSIKDMLTANNRSNWITTFETNTRMKDYIIEHPNDIMILCDNSQNIEKWIEEQRGAIGTIPQDVINNLTRQVANCDFTSKILLIG